MHSGPLEGAGARWEVGPASHSKPIKTWFKLRLKLYPGVQRGILGSFVHELSRKVRPFFPEPCTINWTNFFDIFLHQFHFNPSPDAHF